MTKGKIRFVWERCVWEVKRNERIQAFYFSEVLYHAAAWFWHAVAWLEIFVFQKGRHAATQGKHVAA